MPRLILFRILQAAPVIVIVSILAFFLINLLPGDPAVVIAGDQAPPEAIAAVRHNLGLDRPLIEQLGIWFVHLAQGNFGQSLMLNQSVLSAMGERLPVTLSLALFSLIITLPIGIFAGAFAAYHRGSWIDSTIMTLALLGVSAPAFWIAILAIILFSVILRLFPTGGYVPFESDPVQWLRALVLPAAMLSLFQIGFLARMTRSAMLDVLSQDYIRTARAKGLSEFAVVLRHALRNALIPVVTLGALELGTLLSGAVLTEQVFSVPGFGKLIVDAVFNRDYPVVQGVVLVTATVYVTLNLLADVLYVLINPRMRTA